MEHRWGRRIAVDLPVHMIAVFRLRVVSRAQIIVHPPLSRRAGIVSLATAAQPRRAPEK